MSTTTPALRVSGLGKRYALGLTHAGSLSGVVNRWSRRLRGLPPEEATIDAAVDSGPKSGEFWALDDVSFEVQPGEVVGVIGRNGAGKSTLLKILSRVTAPTTGTVEVNGRVGSLLEVGTGFHPELTGRENIYMNATLLGMTKREVNAKLDEIVAFSGVEKFLDTPVKRYSSGMTVRLGFAVAAHLEPEVLIVDEVLSVGDAAFQKRCLGKMKKVAGEGRTVLFVSHNMGAVEKLCGRIVHLAGGRVVEDSAEVRPAVARYLHGDRTGTADVGAWRPDTGRGDGRADTLLRVNEFGVFDADGRPATEPVSNAVPLFVEADLDVHRPDPLLTFGYALWRDVDCLYWSFKHDRAEADWPPVEVGRQRFRCPLPHRLLGDGDYRIEFLAALHNHAWLFEPGGSGPAMQFQISDAVGDSSQWTTSRRTPLAPVLPWERVAGPNSRPSAPSSPPPAVRSDDFVSQTA